MLKVRTGARMVHVPYRGAVPAALDLSAGRVDLFFVSYSSLLPFLQGGKVKVLAVTSPEPLPALPQVPTMHQEGFDGIALDAWFGLVAPAGTPDHVIAKLNSAFVSALRDPDTVRQIREQGADARASTPAEFGRFIASETERIGALVRMVEVKGE
jgi:tripartite-type tricarboxylate transporter receptor subunit TctC